MKNALLRRFTKEAWDYACEKIPPNALGQTNHSDIFAEKLSELILKECAEIVWDYYNEHSDQFAGPTIEEYFGINL